MMVSTKCLPSVAEVIAAAHCPRWEIWRELLPSGEHGDWIACRWTGGDELRAATIEDLAALLAAEE